MSQPAPHRRRGPWPAPIVVERRKGATVAAHSHRQARWPILVLSGLVLVLTVAVIILAIFMVDFQQFVDGRGEYRDAEARRLEAQISAAVCDVLDELPPAPRLDMVRDRYGCGPGTP